MRIIKLIKLDFDNIVKFKVRKKIQEKKNKGDGLNTMNKK